MSDYRGRAATAILPAKAQQEKEDEGDCLGSDHNGYVELQHVHVLPSGQDLRRFWGGLKGIAQKACPDNKKQKGAGNADSLSCYLPVCRTGLSLPPVSSS